MKTSTDRILTTHVGSLPVPRASPRSSERGWSGQTVDDAQLAARVGEAVADVVRRQADVGLDVISDGEMGKTSFLNYTDDRLAGFVTLKTDDPNAPATSTGASWARRIDTRREWRAFREYYGEYLPRAMPPSALPSVCEGPISYKGQAALQRELATFAAARNAVDVEESFVPAIAPAMVGRGQNRYYATEEEYVFAIAEALRTEYKAIVDAGFILQIDDPGLGETWDMMIPAPPLEEYRRMQTRNIDALNHALAGIPEDRVRYHLCWGSWQGPHVHDLGLRDIVDLMLRVKAQAYSVEAATPRHSYEWRVWEDVKLPEGKVLIPGVIAHTTAVVEHPGDGGGAHRDLRPRRRPGTGHRGSRLWVCPGGALPAPASHRHVGEVRGAGPGGQARLGAVVLRSGARRSGSPGKARSSWSRALRRDGRARVVLHWSGILVYLRSTAARSACRHGRQGRAPANARARGRSRCTSGRSSTGPWTCPTPASTGRQRTRATTVRRTTAGRTPISSPTRRPATASATTPCGRPSTTSTTTASRSSPTSFS